MTTNDIDIPDDTEPDIEPDITVIDVRGEKQVAFRGLDQLHIPESDKDEIHDIYGDIIIALDAVKDRYVGPDRAWHVGRILDEFDVQNDDDISLKELGKFNTIDDMYARRLFYARYIYTFWPDQNYDPRHSTTALGEFASRALNSDRTEQSKRGYNRLHDAGEDLPKDDVLAWARTPLDPSLDDIVAELANVYSNPKQIVDGVKRTVLLLNRPLSSVSETELKATIKQHM